MRRVKRLLLGIVVAVVVLAGCTSGQVAPSKSAGTTVTSTATRTRSSDPRAFSPAPAATVRPLPPGKKAPKGERNKRCPYIRTGLNEDPTDQPNVADIEGNRIYRTTVLTTLRPMGCRFYFIGPPYQATADIQPRTFATAAQAHNAMVRTAQAGKSVRSFPNFVKGVDGISYRTKFFGEDGARDWAFVFAKGKIMVVVHTQENDAQVNALYLARAVVGKF